MPQQDIPRVRVGQRVTVRTDDLGGAEFSARVTAFDSIVDQAARNVQVQETLSNPLGKLRPGMVVQTELSVGSLQELALIEYQRVIQTAFRESRIRSFNIGRCVRLAHNRSCWSRHSRSDRVCHMCAIGVASTRS